MIRIIHDDCVTAMRKLQPGLAHSMVCDPPAGISFMGKDWDSDRGGRNEWIKWMSQVMKESLRVLKPGAYALVWALPRTSHWTMLAMENAGFDIRDVVVHIFGQGFPKSYNVAKGVEATLTQGSANWNNFRKLNKKNETKGGNLGIVKANKEQGNRPEEYESGGMFDLDPTTPQAKKWMGYGTALKPACEFWVLAQKPFEGSIADNILKYGTGALNIDGCRIKYDGPVKHIARESDGVPTETPCGWKETKRRANRPATPTQKGRWPAHLLLDEEAAKVLDAQSGESKSPAKRKVFSSKNEVYGQFGKDLEYADDGFGDTGGASRFFYVAKPSRKEKEHGLQGETAQIVNDGRETSIDNPFQRGDTKRLNTHPTVKSIKLMRYLTRLVTPKDGIILDCFMGSGTTGIAAIKEGFGFVGIEKDRNFYRIAKKRIEKIDPKG